MDIEIGTFDSGGVQLAYGDTGPLAAQPEKGAVLLIHGFASNMQVNWIGTGWFDALYEVGYRVIAIDNRGHGKSEKIYDKAQYGAPIMAEDARGLLDHLDLPHAHVMGYSMGARISAFLAMTHPARVRSVVFGGLGINMVRGVGGSDAIAAALEAGSVEAVDDENARMFRQFAERTGGDLVALATCIRSARVKIKEEALAALDVPVLVTVGTDDGIAGDPQLLADIIPGARAFSIPQRDHNRAVGAPPYKTAVLNFYAEIDG
ncbi:MAG: alpha/beta hydrolase [Pseudomonadota bacterium]